MNKLFEKHWCDVCDNIRILVPIRIVEYDWQNDRFIEHIEHICGKCKAYFGEVIDLTGSEKTYAYPGAKRKDNFLVEMPVAY